GHRWVLYDAALIVENELHRWLDALIVVAADRKVQRERLRECDGLSDDQIDERLEAQMPLEKKLAVADYVIDNNGSLEETRRQVERVHDEIERGVREHQSARPSQPRTSP
ncbi:MAG: dephospho-CoA kinase, partial [Persicimonas sp.]